jgi:Na+-transporting methylmalonyl-CoA/oxaloacetate decarboxylase gamma subunit
MPILFYFIILLRLTVEMMSHVLSNPNQIKKNQTKKNMNIKKKLGLY